MPLFSHEHIAVLEPEGELLSRRKLKGWGWEDKKGDPRQKYPWQVRDSSFPCGPILWPGTVPQ